MQSRTAAGRTHEGRIPRLTDAIERSLPEHLRHTDIQSPSLQERWTHGGQRQIPEFTLSRCTVRGIGRDTQKCISCAAQAEREINIGAAAPLKCFIKLSVPEKRRTPHKKCKAFKERTHRGFLVMLTHPRFRICALCGDAFGVDILP